MLQSLQRPGKPWRVSIERKIRNAWDYLIWSYWTYQKEDTFSPFSFLLSKSVSSPLAWPVTWYLHWHLHFFCLSHLFCARILPFSLRFVWQCLSPFLSSKKCSSPGISPLSVRRLSLHPVSLARLHYQSLLFVAPQVASVCLFFLDVRSSLHHRSLFQPGSPGCQYFYIPDFPLRPIGSWYSHQAGQSCFTDYPLF